VELQEIDVIGPEPLQRQPDLVARFGVGALAGLRRDEAMRSSASPYDAAVSR
jgi:hypothetical protein